MASVAPDNPVLPLPAEVPDGYVLVFDGECRFCRANTRWIRAIDRNKIAYLSLHDQEVQERWPELTHEMLMEQIYLIDGDGQKHAGAAAFRFLSRKLPALRIMAPLLHIPGSLPVWQFAYKAIARIRYRFGRVEECDGSCHLHFN